MIGANFMNNNLEQNFKDEQKLLLLCARTHLNSEIKSQLFDLLRNDLNWEWLVKFAEIHRLIPLLYWNLKEFQSKIPETVFMSLKKKFYENGKKNLLMLGELIKLLNLFENYGLTVIPYKGPLLAISVYKNLFLRQFDDIDIYLNKKDVLKVKDILKINDYLPQFDLKGFNESKFISSQREYKFFNPENNIMIEIHWHFQGVSFSLSKDICYFGDSENIKQITINNKKILSISPDNMLLILCIHTSGHLWERLSWICDISEMIQSHEINWDYVLKTATKLGINRIVLINLLLARDLLDLKLPPYIEKSVHSKNIKILSFKITRKIFNPSSDNILKSIELRFKIRERRIDRIKDILKIMFLPTNLEWDNSTSKQLFPPLSYVYRLISILKNL